MNKPVDEKMFMELKQNLDSMLLGTPYEFIVAMTDDEFQEEKERRINSLEIIKAYYVDLSKRTENKKRECDYLEVTYSDLKLRKSVLDNQVEDIIKVLEKISSIHPVIRWIFGIKNLNKGA